MDHSQREDVFCATFNVKVYNVVRLGWSFGNNAICMDHAYSVCTLMAAAQQSKFGFKESGLFRLLMDMLGTPRVNP
jgi:hypothetical protein